MTVLTVETI